MKHLIIIFCILTTSCTCMGWTRGDTMRQAAFTAVLAADTVQTLHIVQHPDRFHEENPILGRHPGKENVLAFMGAVAVIHACVSCVLSPKYRQWWQYGSIIGKTALVLRNKHIGIGVSF